MPEKKIKPKRKRNTYRTAVITGASRGLGRALAVAFAARGLNLMLAARSEKPLRTLTQTIDRKYPGRIAYVVTDLRSAASIQALFDAVRTRFGPADVLVNNAAVQIYKPFSEWSETEIVDTVNVNLTALMLCTHLALKDMLAQRRGLVINVGSDLSRRYLANMAPYVATKFGVLGFGGSLLRQVKAHGVQVCTVMPGAIDTRLNGSAPQPASRAMRPAAVAEIIAGLLDQPQHLIIDELTFHPLHQEF